MARTRALYAWEQALLHAVPGVTRLRDVSPQAWNSSALHLWCGIWRRKSRMPKIEIRLMKGPSYAYGRAQIVLAENEAFDLILLHELIHCRGCGSMINPHGVGFVRAYVDTLSLWYGWDREFLEFEAMSRGLL